MDARSPATIADIDGEQRSDTDEERWLYCVDCRARITPASAAAVINGAHEHEFMNPSGLRFTVRCFERAAGCRPDGARSTVWTWFPGFAWQIELCGSCACHIGWSFHAATRFYGLIRERLVSS